MHSIEWQKSTYSGDGSNCVYVLGGPADVIRLRESDAPDTVLTTTTERLRHLIRALKSTQ
ncbi:MULTISPECIES: DUF397 domain-containing protein [Streptomyces]|uniref:DUF397 domain-containing protein n=1 Tax=Streptomyces TaxID=1883 RepID=UPI0033E4B038|nr:DUF397 domain-containing protein [Streptomyces sp. NBC_00988]